jgi:hypothetical protein
MPERTLRLPVRPPPPPPRGGARRRERRRRPIAWIVVLSLIALLIVGAWAWWNGSVGPVAIREHCTALATDKSTELDPEQAGNAAIIAAVARRRGLPARAASIGIATAIQESKLRNIEYGDRDSLGLFQQRPSQGWGTRQQILDPVHATNAFLDALVKVHGFENMSITEVAQRVQHSGFPSAYADHEPEARIIASALSGYSPAGFTCVLRSSGASPQAANGGLTARARTVRKAAAHEAGRTSPTPIGMSGTTLRFTVPTSAGDTNAWALAHWAVARAGGLDIVEVDVAGRTWNRQHSTNGWTALASTAPSSQVTIRVA